MSHPGNNRTRMGGLQVRQVYSSVHKHRPCQPCSLCKQGNQSKYFHPKSWKDTTLLERLKQSEPSLDILPDSCICRLCRDDLSKLGSEGHTPRWRKMKQNNVKRVCYVSGCSNPSSKVTQLANKATLDMLFSTASENEPPTSTSDDEGMYPLCQEHYGLLYRHLNPLLH